MRSKAMPVAQIGDAVRNVALDQFAEIEAGTEVLILADEDRSLDAFRSDVIPDSLGSRALNWPAWVARECGVELRCCGSGA